MAMSIRCGHFILYRNATIRNSLIKAIRPSKRVAVRVLILLNNYSIFSLDLLTAYIAVWLRLSTLTLKSFSKALFSYYLIHIANCDIAPKIVSNHMNIKGLDAFRCLSKCYQVVIRRNRALRHLGRADFRKAWRAIA